MKHGTTNSALLGPLTTGDQRPSPAAHTLGPWTARGGGSGPRRPDPEMMDYTSGVDCVAPFTENEHGDFAQVEEQTVAIAKGRTLKEAEANARLIAAAPEMLAALKEISRNAALSDAWLAPVLAAIAKVERPAS